MENYNLKELTEKELKEFGGGLFELLLPVMVLAPLALGVYVGYKAAENKCLGDFINNSYF